MKPIVIVNFKTYEQGTGKQALELAKTCEEYGAWIACQATDIRLLVEQTNTPVFAQHIDAIKPGAHTGNTLPEAIKEAGATGTLLNHTEKPLTIETIEASIQRCKELKLTTIVCAKNLEEAKKISPLQPDYIALELPELIGGETSIIQADPELITKAVEELGNNILMGAGIHTGEDLQKSIELGTKGVLLASAIVSKTNNHKEALQELYRLIT